MTGVPFLIANADSRAKVAVKAQQEPHMPYSLTGCTLAYSTQLTELIESLLLFSSPVMSISLLSSDGSSGTDAGSIPCS